MIEILEGTRKINKLLHKAEKMNYNEISAVLGNVMEANLYIMDRDGKVLGYALQDGFECDLMIDLVIKVGNFPERYVEWLMSVSETLPNTRLKGGMCTFERSKECLFRDKFTTIVPIYGAGERIGTLIVAKFNKEFETPDLILAEYGATVVGMELLRDRSEKKEEETRKKQLYKLLLQRSLIPKWKQSFISSMNWAVTKVFSLRARSLIASVSRVLLSSMHFVNSKVRALSNRNRSV